MNSPYTIVTIANKATQHINKKYNLLTIKSFSHIKEYNCSGGKVKRAVMVNAVCDCGKEKIMMLDNIVSGASKSCGHVAVEKTIKRSTKHGFATRKGWTKEHKIWCGMMRRCYDKKCAAYSKYGGVGIFVCERWHEFKNFIQDMGLIPDGKDSIDRHPNNRGIYEPGNCRWANDFEQSRNRTNNVNVTINGDIMTAREAEKVLGLPKDRIQSRIKAGYSEKEAILLPKYAKRFKNYKEKYGV